MLIPVIKHRLDVLNKIKEKRKQVQIDDLYASVIPPAPTGKRQHQSAEGVSLSGF